MNAKQRPAPRFSANRRSARWAAAAWLGILAVTGALGAAANDTPRPGTRLEGDEVVRRVNDRDDGRFLSQTLEIRVEDKRGNARERSARTYRRYQDGVKQSVIHYVAPANVRGTAFLTWDYVEEGKEDDQWLYLPELRRVRRISAAERGAFFLGTDFSYENIKNETKIAGEDYEWSFLGWQNRDDCECIVLEGRARSDRIAQQLKHRVVQRWIDPTTWLTRRLEYWSDGNQKVRTITAHDIRQVQGVWTAHELVAENHETGGRSVFRFSDLDYRTELRDDLFTQDALRRGAPE